mmetsp:Transcript_29249/g.53485  ORF Transcript_29249/g.53485 Transcript_29249/m.53485 type:complete len:90 (-) Transcript_29249:154-423(-)
MNHLHHQNEHVNTKSFCGYPTKSHYQHAVHCGSLEMRWITNSGILVCLLPSLLVRCRTLYDQLRFSKNVEELFKTCSSWTYVGPSLNLR